MISDTDPKDELFNIPAYHVMEHVLSRAQDWTLSMELMVTNDLAKARARLQELTEENLDPTYTYSIEETVGAPIAEVQRLSSKPQPYLSVIDYAPASFIVNEAEHTIIWSR